MDWFKRSNTKTQSTTPPSMFLAYTFTQLSWKRCIQVVHLSRGPTATNCLVAAAATAATVTAATAVVAVAVLAVV